MKKNEIKDELEKLSPFLSKFKKDKKNGFSMPANYFERFEDRLMNRIYEEEALEATTSPDTGSASSPTIRFWSFVRLLFIPQYAAGFSIGIVVIVFGLYFFNNGVQTVDQPILLAQVLEEELTLEETKDYIINNIDDFATEDIVESLAAAEVDDIQADLPTIEKTVIEEVEIEETQDGKSSMDKAFEEIENEDFLDDLTEEDLEDEADDLF
jgi:hypothetical protein